MRRVLLGLALCAAAAGLGLAQTLTGPARCTACHDHAKQARQWQVDEPQRSGGRAHVNALARLDDPKAAGLARAIGLTSAWAAGGACVSCHATVFRGGPNAGVSCESCHGPASGWIELHQTRGSYPQAVASGMRDLRGKPHAIAGLCVTCHVTTDGRLVAAGHPSGASFDAGARLAKIEHWTTRYDAAQLSATARALSTRLSVAAGSASGASSSRPPAVASAGGAATPPPSVASSSGAAWQDVRPLPSDYTTEPGQPSAAEPFDSAPDLLQPSATASLAEDRLHVSLPIAPSATATPQAPAGEVLALRGRGLLLLATLLREGQSVRVPVSPGAPAEFAGPESELLRLQEELFALLRAELGKRAP